MVAINSRDRVGYSAAMGFSKIQRSAPCLVLVLGLSPACLPDVDSGNSDSATDTTTAGTTDTTTDASPTTGASDTESTGGEPLPCDGVPAPVDAELLSLVGTSEEPDALVVRLANEALTCDEPDGWPACGDNWIVDILIPTDIQTPGIYALGDVAKASGFTSNDDCNGYVGSNLQGTLEIVAVDENEVTGRVCHLDGAWVDNNPMAIATSFSFAAPRCPQ
jgi:hypothetical protein